MAILPERSLLLLVTDNPQRLIEFYTAGFGFTLSQQIPNYAELTLGNFILALTDAPFMATFLGVPLAAARPQRFVISLHSDAVDADLARLLALGASIIMPPTDQPWHQRVCYLADPEGNVIELTQRIEA
jgi:lactoylglutathione lyase